MNFKCSNCGAALTVEGTLRTVVCAFCASPSVVERSASEVAVQPTFTLGFVQPETAVQQTKLLYAGANRLTSMRLA